MGNNSQFRDGLWYACLIWITASAGGLLNGTDLGRSVEGDERSASVAEPQPVEEFAKVKAEWDVLEKRLSDMIAQFREVPAEQREPLRKAYLELVASAPRALSRLRSSSIAEYRRLGNEQKEVVRTLLGLLSNDLKTDQYAQALEIARLLIERECPDKTLLGKAAAAAYGLNDFSTAQRYLQQAAEANLLDAAQKMLLAELTEIREEWEEEQQRRERERKADDLPRVRLTTSKGEIVVELFENEAPQTVANFIHLVENKFYDGLTFHRVVGGLLAQAGCPKGDGTGGPGYRIYSEVDREDARHHFAGYLSLAHDAGANTGGSQFFFTFAPAFQLDTKHTVFGRILEGQEVLTKLHRRQTTQAAEESDRIVRAVVIRKRSHAYEPRKVSADRK
jgi:cyclophilin family peptidyl-prolyl cis-trans isomerase